MISTTDVSTFECRDCGQLFKTAKRTYVNHLPEAQCPNCPGTVKGLELLAGLMADFQVENGERTITHAPEIAQSIPDNYSADLKAAWKDEVKDWQIAK